MEAASDMIRRLIDSIGEPVHEDTTGWAYPPAPRESWIDLQLDAVAVAGSTTGDGRRDLARALLRAIVEQESSGPSNRLDPSAFAFLLDTLGDELVGTLDRGAARGGQRYLRAHLWTVAGDEGARWLARLAAIDDYNASTLFQRMRIAGDPRWADEDWPARLDVVAGLPPEPRPGIVSMLFAGNPPRGAAPALMRVALAHGVDERDNVVRYVAEVLGAYRGNEPVDDLDLVDWDHRSNLSRWILELMGPAGYRPRLVAAARQADLVTDEAAAFLVAPIDRPAWADGEVPWVVDGIHPIGAVHLPSRRLTGGDPWYTGGLEGFPWTIELEAPELVVDVVTAQHPLYGRDCCALVGRVTGGPVERWQLLATRRDEEGYRVEVGIAGFGSVECYESGPEFELTEEIIGRTPPVWHLQDGRADGSIAMCSVGPQHQLCRTWIGSGADGAVVAVVTDLGLIDLDLERDQVLPW